VQRECLRQLDVLKLDVEGAELSVLTGASGILRQQRPFLLLELNDTALRLQGSSGAAVVEFLRAFDYEIYGFDAASGQPRSTSEVELSDNILARPVKKATVSRVA
jgi:hypothetical protein